MFNILKAKKNKQKQIKKIEKRAKKIETTLSWIDIDKIVDDAMILKKEKKTIVVKGIKITPRNILIENEVTQSHIINHLRGIFNRLQFPLYHQYVYSKVNIMNHYEHLQELFEQETNPIIKELIEDDLRKANAFSEHYKELSFFILIQSENQSELQKNFNDLCLEFERSPLEYEPLLKSDYQNLCSYLFENDLIQDYYFLTGDFAMLNEQFEFSEEMLYDV